MTVIKSESTLASGFRTTKLLVGPVGRSRETGAEVVVIERREKTIICFSTQIGCPVGCHFCASGLSPWIANLTAEEMAMLIDEALRIVPPNLPVLLSAMGEGDPALNVKNTISAIRHWVPDREYRYAVSTSGPNYKTMQELLEAIAVSMLTPFTVQYSLHHANVVTRQALMPHAKLEPVNALRLLAEFEDRMNGAAKVELNIVLFDGLNDHNTALYMLIELLASVPHPWHVKFNRYNPVPEIGSVLKPADPGRLAQFQHELREAGYTTEYYATDGSDIQAACGQLRSTFARAP